MSLPVEPPREAIAADEALLDQIQDDVPLSLWERAGVRERWWLPNAPAVVVGLGLRHRLASIVDLERCERMNVAVIERRAGGGALLLDEHMLCGAICVPTSSVPSDVTESYRWLGERLTSKLRVLGIHARRVEVEEARADAAALRAAADDVARVLVNTCYGVLSPHEVVVGNAKVVGLAQVRRRHATLFQIGILIRDQSCLADYLVVRNEDEREQLRVELRRRTIGLAALTDRPVDEVAAAIVDATPSLP